VLWRWDAKIISLQDQTAGGERAAAMYSLIGTAKLNDLDPEAYLSHVLARIADHRINRIEELLPWNIGLPRGQTRPLNKVESGRFPLAYLPIARKIRQWVTRWLIGSEHWRVRFGEVRPGLTSR
jgi:hypothetical protein